MRSRRKIPASLIVIGVVIAIALHVAALLQIGSSLTVAGSVGVAVLLLVVKHFGLGALRRGNATETEGIEKRP